MRPVASSVGTDRSPHSRSTSAVVADRRHPAVADGHRAVGDEIQLALLAAPRRGAPWSVTRASCAAWTTLRSLMTPRRSRSRAPRPRRPAVAVASMPA